MAGRIVNVLVEQLVRVFSLSWFTGPIFDKELRVSSRRRRNYVLRFAYVSLFTIVLALIWQGVVPHGSSSAYQSSRMAEAGQFIVLFVIWFQFIAVQIVAVVMLSTSISDEIYKRTLGLLMTTPIGSFQIVFGKLLSKLLQLILLLAMTLPLLAIVRVFGGVPWSSLVSGLCVTLTTALFVGSLCLVFSIFSRKAYSVIIATVLVVAFLFAILPLVAAMVVSPSGQNAFMQNLSMVNPFVLMFLATLSMVSARTVGVSHWPVHCGISLAVSAVLLVLATIFVRKAALRQAVGATRSRPAQKPGGSPQALPDAGSIRRVVGPAVLWKERRLPLLGRRRMAMMVVVLMTVGLVLFTYALCAAHNVLSDDEIHLTYAVIFTALGLLFTTVLPATAVTSEKESRTWSLLLTTTVSDGEIIWGKFAGAVRRCLPAWLLLLGHAVLFCLAGIIRPLGVLQLVVLVAWSTFFLCATGLYFSTRFRHTTTAVIANVSLAAGIWAVFPLLLGLVLAMTRAGDDVLETYLDFNPFVHAVVIVGATTTRGTVDLYEWLHGGCRNVLAATGWIALTLLLYAVFGTTFLLQAKRRLRRDPF